MNHKSFQKTVAEKRIERVKALFCDVTPLKTDCGLVCSGACCKGDDKTGMLLFPGERTPLTVLERDARRLAVCAGTCDRDDRPLSCRIFPFFPVVEEDGNVLAAIDARAFSVCPLARQAEAVAFDPRFIRRVKIAGRILLNDPEAAAFLREIAEEIKELTAAREKLTK